MLSNILLSSLLATAALAAPASYFHTPNTTNTTNTSSNNIGLIHALLLAPTAVDRVALLSDVDYVYDFANPPANAITSGKGGRTVKADRKTFPALIGSGVSMTVGFLGPCGFNTPHVHPRSSEINIVVKGRMGTAFIAENGARAVHNILSQYQMTVFAQGATHTEFNPDCEDTVLVAGFANEDPGVEQSAQTLFELESDIVEASLGVQTVNGADIDAFRKRLPKNVALGVESCLKKCGISKRSVGAGSASFV